jgi:hypothetical protein
MYKRKGVDIVLEEVVARIRYPDKPLPAKKHKPVTYAASDIAKAKIVLDRLLSITARSEISSIEVAVEEDNER